DVMCHLPNRLDILREWHRVTVPGARILYTDPTIVTGLVTDSEIADRSAVGVYVFSAEWVNETVLAEAGFELSHREDLTENMAAMAGRWHDARARFRGELLTDEGEATFEGIQRFLAACHLLARERRLSRYAYLARRGLVGRANAVPGEPEADQADEDGEDDAERRRRQREGEERAEDAADRAEHAEAERDPEVADAAAPQNETPSDGGGKDHEERRRLGGVLGEADGQGEERDDECPSSHSEQPRRDADHAAESADTA